MKLYCKRVIQNLFIINTWNLLIDFGDSFFQVPILGTWNFEQNGLWQVIVLTTYHLENIRYAFSNGYKLLIVNFVRVMLVSSHFGNLPNIYVKNFIRKENDIFNIRDRPIILANP